MGTKNRRTTRIQSAPPLNMIKFMVKINRPSSKKLAGLNRAETYKILKDNSVKCKDEIKAWIKAHGLDSEVFKIEEPTVFNMLFITCTPKVAKQLENSDVVISVTRNPKFSVKLIEQ